MDKKKRSILSALLGAAILAAFGTARWVQSSETPVPQLFYQTSCVVLDVNSVEGYVSNQSQEPYRVVGEVRFEFSMANSMSRAQIQAQSDASIRGGETARVARARLAFALRPGETCRFDVGSAIRKDNGGLP